MNRRQSVDARYEGRNILTRCHIAIGQDFHTLTSLQVEYLLEEADAQRYRKPPNANGSRARYFHDRLQRNAQLKDS